MKITRRNAVLCVLLAVFVLSLPIYVFWTVFNYEHLNSWTEKKFCGFIDKQIIQKKTMETTKEEMMMLLRELHDLQMWLLNSGRKFSLIITLCGNLKIFASVVGLTYRCVNLSNRKPFNKNAANLDDFIDYVKRTEYECRKNETC